jgi:hypothetical protein
METNKIYNSYLRSRIECAPTLMGNTFKPSGYVGNRPSDFEGKEHEDDTWAIDLYDSDDNIIDSYLYVSEFEYQQDVVFLTKNNLVITNK